MPALAYDRSMRSKDAFGRLHVEQCNIGKATVSPYFGREIPGYKQLGLHPDQIYQLYRDPAELQRAADTFDNCPILIKHVPVSAARPEQDLTVGTTGNDTVYEHPFLKSSVSVWTQDAIDLIETHEQEQLSPAYLYDPDMRPGVSPEGLHYDGVMRNIIGNHVALVALGRQGPDVVVADAIPLELPEMKFPKFVAALVSLFATPPTVEQQLALDSAVDELLAQDGHGLSEDEMKSACDAWAKENNKACDAMSDEEKSAAYKRAALDKATPAAPVGGAPKPGANDIQVITPEALAAAVAAAKAEGIAETQAAAKLAQDEAAAAIAAAKSKADALATARADVAEVCGDVTCDSAESVYEFAFKHLAVDITGVPPAAYPAVFRVAAKTAVAAAPLVSTLAADAAKIFPALANIRKG